MRSVLDGVRVIEWSMYGVGPAAGAMLADLGAEVIKIEEPIRGDGLRGFETSAGGIPVHLPNGCNVLFEEHNRNKKSLAVDLKTPSGLEIMYGLVARADVFLTNFRPKVVQGLGLGYEQLKSHNPMLVYASSAGFGHKGPDAELGTIDYVAQARSGVMISDDRAAEPVAIPPGMGDRITAIYLAYGILAALLAREKSGTIQEVRTNQLGSYIAASAFSVMLAVSQDRTFRRDRADAPNPLVNWYLCQDGVWIMLGSQEESFWHPFCQAIGASELEKDPRFATSQSRTANSKELVTILNSVFEAKPYASWAKILARWDCRFSRVNSFAQLMDDPQVIANDCIVEWDNPKWGPMKIVGFPVELTETPLSLRTAAPEIGEHTKVLLAEICGYSPEQISDLKNRGIVAL